MMFTDPVCGMQVDDQHDAASITYKDKAYYFCCEGCLRAFDRHPEVYLNTEGDGGHDAHHP